MLNCMKRGCKGDYIENVMERMVKHGIPLEKDEPYKAKVRKSCKLILVINY